MSKPPKGFSPIMTDEMTEPDSLNPAEGSGLEEAGPADASHLDGVVVDEVEGTVPEPSDVGAEQTQNLIGPEEFHHLFCGMFGIAHALTELKSLRIDSEGPTTRPCTTAIYEIAQDTPALHWMLNPGGPTMKRIGAILAFSVPVGLGVRSELKARSAAKKAAARTGNDNAPHPANDNGGAELVGVPVG